MKEIVLSALKENMSDDLLPLMNKIFRLTEGEKGG